ncbi:MAG: pseudouridine synthase [Rubrobacter sp.]|jgi:23S rRNA pseudouridine2605 synthase|nr:rRNA pseudouridine synthase [Rubrobacteraceae bacterium]MDQ3251952.1 rRNA pseudouridine synthase [Actinomycetota bacterium]MDQ3435899.1 rRNA pseudouridine synthase [Actinomycetota bacterium]
MRLQAFLARAGAAPSRRKAEAPILAGRVTVNGERATLGATVTPEDEVELDGRPVRLPETSVYLALHKPAGYLTTMKDERGRRTVAQLMPEVPGLVPAGRLDASTTGLLILTNDGGLAHRITHPSSEVEKQYSLTLENPVPEAALAALAAGPTLEDGRMHTPEVANLSRARDSTTLDLTVHEGRNRIIRRACLAVGLRLISLHRTRVGPVNLGDLPEGEYRAITPSELEALH